jgi:hypothetical protein
LNDKSQLASVVISSFLLNRLERVPQVPILSDMLNFDVWKLLKSGGSHEAGEFIRFSAGSIQIKSSIVSTFLLRNAISPEVLIWNIERIVRRLASIRRSSALHHVFTELQRFPLLEGIITSPKKREIIIGYFQSIKDLPFCERNALFWLHYAMARLSFGDFPNATIYFEQAKKLAQGNVGETRDVNNHFARLLLDSRIKGDEYDDYFGAFEKAHSILVEQMNRNSNRHYPYRQAKKYVEYISYRKDKFTPSELEMFKSACKQVKSAIGNLSGPLAANYDVRQCGEQMDRAIELASIK